MANGKDFENKISKGLQKITKKELGFFIKSPTPMQMVPTTEGYIMTYANKALCDFIGIYQGKFILIEAKEISGTRFEFRRLKDHQLQQLSAIKKYGGYAWIYFNLIKLKKIVAVPIDSYLVSLTQTSKKSINIDTLNEIGYEINLAELIDFFNQEVN